MTELTWIDWVLLVVMTSSTLLAVLRGFVHEITGVALWVLALFGAYKLGPFVAAPLSDFLIPPLPEIIGFILIALFTLLLGRLIRATLKELVTASGAAPLDKFLGGIFGMMRGVAISVIIAVLIALTPLPNERVWQVAWSRPFLEFSLVVANPWLPSFISSRVADPDRSSARLTGLSS